MRVAAARRRFLALAARSTALAITGVGRGAAAAISSPPALSEAFASDALPEALVALFGRADLPVSDDLAIEVAEPVEDGAIVPVTITVPSALRVDALYVLASRNPVPLIARFSFPFGMGPVFRTRIKLAETSEILVVTEQGDTRAMARREVEVAIGGCSVMT